ncbi:hypothetical protein [Zavarzinella formosa]|uniref:hypothetical protein n=1 Tax=Zavarzinella formosa TaxID=360055 RepID=UPI0002DC7960|nr:hypothetical protein [Zavarzinella formosa]
MDIPARIQAIKDADPNWRRDPRTLEIAKLAWGAECHVNNSGVFCPRQEEVVARCGKATATVGLCKVREHVWVFCTSIQTSNFGYSYAPSVWLAEPFESEDEARRAGIAELIERTERKGGLSHGERAEMEGLRKALRGMVSQPTLFG